MGDNIAHSQDAEDLEGAKKTTKIKIRKQDRASGTFIDTMTNGLMERLAVDQEIEVADHTLETLTNSSIAFDVVGEDGVSSSTAPLTDTATRDRPKVDPLLLDEEGNPREVPELGIDGGTGVAGAVSPAIEYDAQLGAQNAEGQGAGANGADQLGGQQGAQDDAAEGHPALKTVDALKVHIGTGPDKAELQKLLEEEKAGKARTTAIEALEAAIAA